MSTRTVDQLVEAVGFDMWQYEYTLAEAQERNAGDGWTADLRFADREYLSDTDYTRVEGFHLTDEELDYAFWHVAMTIGRRP